MVKPWATKKKKTTDNTFGTKKERIFTLLKSGVLTKEQGTGWDAGKVVVQELTPKEDKSKVSKGKEQFKVHQPKKVLPIHSYHFRDASIGTLNLAGKSRLLSPDKLNIHALKTSRTSRVVSHRNRWYSLTSPKLQTETSHHKGRKWGQLHFNLTLHRWQDHSRLKKEMEKDIQNLWRQQKVQVVLSNPEQKVGISYQQ